MSKYSLEPSMNALDFTFYCLFACYRCYICLHTVIDICNYALLHLADAFIQRIITIILVYLLSFSFHVLVRHINTVPLKHLH